MLQESSIGDMKPSSFIRRTKELSCGKVRDDLLKTLWLSRLPTGLQTVYPRKTSILNNWLYWRIEITDSPQIQAISPVPGNQNNPTNDLVNVVYELEAKIESLSRDFRRSKESNGQRLRHRSPTPDKASSVNNSGICFYHKHIVSVSCLA